VALGLDQMYAESRTLASATTTVGSEISEYLLLAYSLLLEPAANLLAKLKK